MRNSRPNPFTYQTLEPRRVLAGNVMAIVTDSILLVAGDTENNQVTISATESGGFIVAGVDTTINGGNGSFVVEQGVRHVTVALENGNDELQVNGIQVASNFSFYGGLGNDRLIVDGLSARHFHAEGNQGDDVFEIDFNIRKSAYLYLGEGNDVVASTNANVGRNFKVFGAGGDDTVSSETLRVGRKLEFHLGDGADQALMSGDTSVRHNTRVDLGAGNDFFAVLPGRNSAMANFRGSISVDAGSGNDNLALDSAVNWRGRLKVTGGAGNDSVATDSLTSGRRVQADDIENFELANLNGLIDDVFTRLEEAGVGVDGPFESLMATATASELSFTENANGVPVDSGFALTGSELITGAVIQIDEFVTGQETLAFSGSGNISGTFNSTAGTMTLTGNASSASYQSAIRSVTYRNLSDDPLTDLRQFNFTITTSEETVNVSRDLRVVAVNDTPGVTFSNANQTIAPEDLPIVLDDSLVVSDADNNTFTSAVVRIVSGLVTGQDVLSSQDSNGITSVYNPTSGALTLTGDASVADWQTVLRTVTFVNEATTPTEGNRTIRFAVNDGEIVGASELQLNLQQEAQPNNFAVSQTANNGTVIGQVTPTNTFQTPTVYQFSNDTVSPVLLLNADDHFSGDPAASVVLIEYLDFECPNCAAFHPVVKQLQDDFDGDLLVVRRHLPLESIHPNARAAAVASEAASRQDRFDEMADLLFENRDQWIAETDPTSQFEAFATTLGLDLTQFRADVADSDVNARVTRDASEAMGIGIQSTASFVLQGTRITNPANETAFNQVIDDAVSDFDQPFVINRETGEIIVQDATLLDAVNNPTMTLSILVADADGTTETISVTVNVTS